MPRNFLATFPFSATVPSGFRYGFSTSATVPSTTFITGKMDWTVDEIKVTVYKGTVTVG